jgi:hypothetical protein
MPFAGSIKLKHFLSVSGLLGFGAVAGAVLLCGAPCFVDLGVDEGPESLHGKHDSLDKMTPERGGQPNSPYTTMPDSNTEIETEASVVLRSLGKALGSAKIKDVTNGQGAKVNVYQDTGQKGANRAKVDLDRDDLWDQKWTLKDGVVTVQESSRDDEVYDQTYLLGTVEVAAENYRNRYNSAKQDSGEEQAPSMGSEEENAVRALLGTAMAGSKRKDATAGKRYKINVYKDAGNEVANRAKLDLDRDDKWDQKWSLTAGVVRRSVSTLDNEEYDTRQEWKDGQWIPDQ